MISPTILIHLMTMSPWILEKSERIFEVAKQYGFSNNDTDYLIYCLKSHDVRSRDYGLLRKVLAENIHAHRDLCRKTLESLIGMEDIQTIYDVGAGHGEWSTILYDIFPGAEIYPIDKDRNVEMRGGHGLPIVGDIHELITRGELRSGPKVLYFMSEFLHCKVQNINLLVNEPFVSSRMCIVELVPSLAVKWRLEQSGGRMIDQLELEEMLKGETSGMTSSTLDTMFQHYILATAPEA